MKQHVRFQVNGESYELDIQPYRTLVDILRDELGLTGTKKGCGTGDCGACTVILNGRAVNSCLILGAEVDGAEILTIEGLKQGEDLHPIQKAFIEFGAIQCGFCSPGMILSAKALLDRCPHPTDEQIRVAISGNLCRCTGYQKIIEAIRNVNHS
jgi:aerobic carbon-monoxide dehydrogenase small subunit